MVLKIELQAFLRQTQQKTMVKIIYGRGKRLSKPKAQKQSEEKITKSIRNLFKLKKENDAIKDRIIRDISKKKMIITNQ